MRFIHLSDIHLGKTFSPKVYGSAANMRKRQLLETVQRVVDFANNHDVDFILCAGDLLHSEEMRVEELRALNSAIERLRTARWISVAGNHDPLGPRSPYRKIEWCPQFTIAPAGFSQLHLPEFCTMLYTFSWDTKEISEPVLDNLSIDREEKFQILLFHGEAGQKSNYLPFSPERMEHLPVDYVALGHIHLPQRFGKKLFYPGSLEPLDFSEMGEHGFFLCDWNGQDKTVTFVPFAQKQYRALTLFVTPRDHLYTVAERIEEQAKEAGEGFFYVELKGEYAPLFPIDSAALQQILLERGLVCKIENQAVPQYCWDALLKENRGNILGEFIASFGNLEDLNAIQQKALRYGVAALLEQKEKKV